MLCCEFKKINGPDGNIVNDFKYFNTKNGIIDKISNLKKWFVENIEDVMLTELEEFQERDSGWALSRVVNLAININKYQVFRISSYIALPPAIQNRKACINVQNNDNACFAWAVISALYPAKKNTNRTSSYPDYKKILNLKGIQFPISLKQIPKFEKMNNLSINVFMLKLIKNQFKVVSVLQRIKKKSILIY